MTKTIKELLDEFVEKGANLEHERWSGWQSYFFSKCQVKPQSQVNGMDDRVERLQAQIKELEA